MISENFHLKGFKGKKVALWVSNRNEFNIVKQSIKWLSQIDYIVYSGKKKNDVCIGNIRIIDPLELLEINIKYGVVVLNISPVNWNAITEFLYKHEVYDVVPINMFQYLSPMARELEEIMLLDDREFNLIQKDNEAILIRGKFDPFFTPIIIKFYKSCYSHKYIVLSTWDDTPKSLLADLGIDKIILNKKPENPSQGHRNYQIECVSSGIKWLKEKGIENALVIRTDMLLMRQGLLEKCQRLIKEYPHKIGLLKNRIIMSNLFFRRYKLYHPSDMFMYGNVDDLLLFWDNEFDFRNANEFPELNNDGIELKEEYVISECKMNRYPEIYFFKSMLEKLNYSLQYTQEDWEKLTKEMFIIRDTYWWGFYWYKPDKQTDFSTFGNYGYPMTCVSQNDWEDMQEEKVEQENNIFSGPYIKWRNKRVNYIMDYYGKEYFNNKKILELGYGDVGAAFAELGAEVICSNGREEYLRIVKERYPRVKTFLYDLDKEWPFHEKFDLIIHEDVLHHVKDYERAITNACLNAKNVILEAEVSDSDDHNFVIYNNEEGDNRALNHIGCRPSGAAVEKILNKCDVEYTMLKDDKCNSDFHVYDWKITNTKAWRHGLRRMWHIHEKSNISEENYKFIKQFFVLSNTGVDLLEEMKKNLLINNYSVVITLLEDITILLECLNNSIEKFSAITGYDEIKFRLNEVVKSFGNLADILQLNKGEELKNVVSNDLIPNYKQYFIRLQQIMNLY